ncbi:hypothetical protein BC834DRAFT_837255 [Gloeopeniophorella convolvens]|nr:hypothetical protein BC834DRAFT_837255 [Gloeopeniophorella convolvens]
MAISVDLVSEGETKSRRRQAKDSNTIVTIVDRTSIHQIRVLYCICHGVADLDQQLFAMGLLPATFRTVETIFTFTVLNDFLVDNLECKTTGQTYYSKLQTITRSMFPHHVPTRYKQLQRASRQWRDLTNRKRAGYGHTGDAPSPSNMAIFSPACPQPGINLPDNFQEIYKPSV